MIQPLYRNVVLKKAEAKTQTSSGIILSSTVHTQSNMATIIAIGPDCQSHLSVDDTVIYNPKGVTSVDIDQENYLIIDEADLLAVITD
ncbi:MAG: co-chaperone GroES [Erysipelotrichaceae bacterium]|nr:co-chaperone GroES [Erysipelotrichaceae bacterium]